MASRPNSAQRKRQVEYLVELKFPHLKDPPTILSLANSGGFEGIEAADTYRTELAALADHDLASLVAEARQREAEHRVTAEAEPPQGEPGAKGPNYELWTKHAYWTIDEIVPLSLGRDPSVVSWAAVKRELDRGSKFAKGYATLREIVTRAMAAGQLRRNTPPPQYVEWADRMRVELPTPLIQAVKAFHDIPDWKSISDQRQSTVDRLRTRLKEQDAANARAVQQLEEMEKDRDEIFGSLLKGFDEAREENSVLTTRIKELEASQTPRTDTLGARERDSLLKLVIGMAVKKYRYDAAASRNAATRNIANDLDLVGVPLDEDTIRKYLALVD